MSMVSFLVNHVHSLLRCVKVGITYRQVIDYPRLGGLSTGKDLERLKRIKSGKSARTEDTKNPIAPEGLIPIPVTILSDILCFWL